MKSNSFEKPTVVSPEKWLAARQELLREEKELTRLQDKIHARRRTLPWIKLDTAYIFESTHGVEVRTEWRCPCDEWVPQMKPHVVGRQVDAVGLRRSV